MAQNDLFLVKQLKFRLSPFITHTGNIGKFQSGCCIIASLLTRERLYQLIVVLTNAQ